MPGSDEKHKTLLKGQAFQALQHVGLFSEQEEKAAYGAVSSTQHSILYPDLDEKRRKITIQLGRAVAYGMESREANDPIKASDSKGLFNSNLYAKDLLEKSPEFLLERAHLTDWAGRTFKGRVTEEHLEGEGITAFEYALWAKDFKMIEMMLKCIPKGEEGDAIRKELLRQVEQVTIARGQGGGLTYTHTYERPKVDAAGIPTKDAAGNWDCETVTEERDENHFELSLLIDDYQNYLDNCNTLTGAERNAYWVKIIGTLQRLLPVHVLQRICDPNMPFYPLPQFNGAFKRFMYFYNWVTNDSNSSLFTSSFSSDFALCRAGRLVGLGVCEGGAAGSVRAEWLEHDMVALRQLDKVSTNEIEKIIQQLSAPQNTAAPRP